MTTVNQLLNKKKEQHEVFSVNPSTLVIDALQLMSDKNIGVVVVLEHDKLVGIFSERDYARKGVIQGRQAATTHISDVMTSNVFTVTREKTIRDCMSLMSTHKFRHLPVMDGEAVVGVLSISDIVTQIISEQKEHIQYLESYISGS
ncbi:MAG: CBS domain-containing protein [Spirosomataceae bacterium]